MAVTVNANGLSIVHQGSGGEANATLPDVCLTQCGPPVVPIPYGNNAKSADLVDGTTTITMDGGNSVAIKGSKFSKSTGDSGGDKKGVASGTIEGEAEFISASPTVKFEGAGVCRLSDQMTMNKANTMCLGGVQNESVSVSEDSPEKYDVGIHVPNLSNAAFTLKDDSGSVVASGKLDAKGKATVSSLAANTTVSGEYEESPDPFVYSPAPIKFNTHYGELPHDEFFDLVAQHERPFWEQKTTSRPEKYTWGIMAERAYPNDMLQQVIELEAKRMSPQYAKHWDESQLAVALLKMLHTDPISVDDTRDFISHLLAIQNPNLSLRQEAYAFYVVLWIDKKITPKELWAQFRYLGTGNPQKAWSDFDWDGLKKHVNQLSDEFFKRFMSRLEAIKTRAELMAYTAVKVVMDAHIDSLKRVKKQLPDSLTEVMDYCKNKVDDIIAKGGDVPVVKSNNQSVTDTRSLIDERYTLAPKLSSERIEQEKLFVFAKSCQRPEGCNDAGTSKESIRNFGDMFHFSVISSANAMEMPAYIKSRDTSGADDKGIDAEDVALGIGAVALSAATFGVAGGVLAAGAIGVAVGESTAVQSAVATQSVLNNGRRTKVPAFSFEQLSPDNLKYTPSYLVTAASLYGFSLLHRTFFEDETQIEDNEIQGLETVSSRVRMRMDLSPDRRYPTVTAYHTDNGVMENIPVKRVTLDKETSVLSVALDDSEAKIYWTPIHEDDPEWLFTPDHDDDFEAPDILVTPLHESEEGDNVETYPAAETNWQDAVLVFPIDTGIPPLYIVYSKKKPPVTFMEVGLYGDFAGRSRLGKYEADHMPSKAAIVRYLKNMFGKSIDKKDIDRLKNRVASIVIPYEVHKNCSETFRGRNTPDRINNDAKDLKSAVESNFKAISTCLKNDYGLSQEELDKALEEMHRLNRKEGWYE